MAFDSWKFALRSTTKTRFERPEKERKFPNFKIEVKLPERICYANFADIDKDIKFVRYPWLVLQKSEEQHIFGKVSPLDGNLSFRIFISKIRIYSLLQISSVVTVT